MGSISHALLELKQLTGCCSVTHLRNYCLVRRSVAFSVGILHSQEGYSQMAIDIFRTDSKQDPNHVYVIVNPKSSASFFALRLRAKCGSKAASQSTAIDSLARIFFVYNIATASITLLLT